MPSCHGCGTISRLYRHFIEIFLHDASVANGVLDIGDYLFSNTRFASTGHRCSIRKNMLKHVQGVGGSTAEISLQKPDHVAAQSLSSAVNRFINDTQRFANQFYSEQTVVINFMGYGFGSFCFLVVCM